ncbi:MAG: diguanylate cyclase domain-containing protein [Thermoleophilia bacterium]
MDTITTTGSLRSREHLKARYRLPLLGVLAALGPSAFGLRVGLLSGLYSLILLVYGLWALRLTVVFRDDPGLGYLLSLFDVALTVPLVLWGRPTWLLAPLVTAWVLGLLASVTIRGFEDRVRTRVEALVDPASGLRTSACFREFVRDEGASVASGGCFAVLTVRVHRFQELVAYYGRDSAERALIAVSRRASREAGERIEAFRLSEDLLALAVPTCGSLAAAELAALVSKSSNRRLVEGRKIDTFVGYAVFPRDGRTADELVASAEATTTARTAWRSPSLPAAVGARVSVAR